MNQLVYILGDVHMTLGLTALKGEIKHSSQVDHPAYGQLAHNNFQHWWFTVNLLIHPYTHEMCWFTRPFNTFESFCP